MLAMSGFVMRGLLTEDGEIDYTQYWRYGFDEAGGRFLAALFDAVVDGEWWEGKWYPFHDPNEPIDGCFVDTIEDLEEIVTGGEIPEEVIAILREEQREYLRRQPSREVEAER